MSNARVYIALALLVLFGWWWSQRDGGSPGSGVPDVEAEVRSGEPKSEAGKRVEAVRAQTQAAADAHAKRMEGAEEDGAGDAAAEE